MAASCVCSALLDVGQVCAFVIVSGDPCLLGVGEHILHGNVARLASPCVIEQHVEGVQHLLERLARGGRKLPRVSHE